jgi:rhamnosyltransferase
LAQEVPWPFEVIVIDSASTDGTWELVKSLAVKPICIQPNEFNHGQTRNLGAHQAKGRFLVFLVQDAVPVNDTWLERLVTAAEYPGVAGSYGRELPWPSDNLLVRLHTQQALAQNQERLYQRLAPELWVEHPYRALSYGEDLDWGARVIQAGYTIVYEPQAVVYHSHDRSSWYTMKRAYADHELVMRLFNYHAFPRPTGLVKSWLTNSWKFMRVIHNEGKSPAEKVRLILRTPMVVGTFHVGSYIGARAAKHQRYGIFWQTIDRLMRKGV